MNKEIRRTSAEEECTEHARDSQVNLIIGAARKRITPVTGLENDSYSRIKKAVDSHLRYTYPDDVPVFGDNEDDGNISSDILSAKGFTDEQIEGVMQVCHIIGSYDKFDISMQRKAMDILVRVGLTSSSHFDDIHTARTHEFSKPSRIPNPFAEMFADTMDEKSDVLCIGEGPWGKDARYYVTEKGANVVALDVSKTATDNLSEDLKGHDYEKNIEVINQDALAYLKSTDRNFSHVASVSSAHYWLPGILAYDMFPNIRRVLMERNGMFCLAMKNDQSDSAHSINNCRLIDERRNQNSLKFRLSMNMTERFIRMYPTNDAINKLFSLSQVFPHPENSFTVEVPDYDVIGDMEQFKVIMTRARL